MIYKTFTEWKNGNWLEDGEPRKEAYTKDELLLVEMGWKYGFDAGKPQTKPLSDEEIYALWCEADNTELLPEMRLKDGSINYIITTFARALEQEHGIK